MSSILDRLKIKETIVMSKITGTGNNNVFFTENDYNLATSGPILFNGADGNTNAIIFNNLSTNDVPTYTNRSIGTRILLFPSLSGSTLDTSIGVNGNDMWLSVPSTSNTFSFHTGGLSYSVRLGTNSLFKRVTIEDTTASTSKTTGALIVAGGIGISGNLFASAGTLDSLNILNTTASTSKTTGALTVAGGLGISGNIYGSAIFLQDTKIVTGNTITLTDYSLVSNAPIAFNGTNGLNNVLNFNRNASNGLPSFNTRSDGTRIIFYSNIGASSLDSAFGVGPATTWVSVPNTNDRFNFYIGETSYRVSIGANSVARNTNSFTDNIGSMNIKGHLVMDFNGTVNNSILWVNNAAGVAKPSFTNRSQGSKLVLSPAISGVFLDYAIGIETGATWFSVPGVNDVFRYYFGSTTHTIELGPISYFKEMVIENTTASTSKTTGALRINGGVGISGNLFAGASTLDSLNVIGSTVSTSKTTGVLIVTGGVGISGNLFASAGTLDSLNILNTTASTSKTTGALTVAGGVGISGNLYGSFASFDSRIILPSDTFLGSTNTFTESNYNIVTNGPICLNGSPGTKTMIHFFGGSGGTPSFTSRSFGTRLLLSSQVSGSLLDTAIGVSGSLLWLSVPDVNDVVRYYFGSTTHSIELGIISYFKGLVVENTTVSTSKTTGALRIAGGLGVSGNLFASAATFDSLNILNTTTSTSKTTGSLTVAGGLGISGNLFAGASTLDSLNITSTLESSFETGSLVTLGGAYIKKALTLDGNLFVGPNGVVNFISMKSKYYSISAELDLTSTFSNNIYTIIYNSCSVGLNDSSGTITNTKFTCIQNIAEVIVGFDLNATYNLDYIKNSNFKVVLSYDSSFNVNNVYNIYLEQPSFGNLNDFTYYSIFSEYGLIKFNDTTQSTSKTTGALTVAGGVGISGNLFAGAGTLNSLNVIGTMTSNRVNTNTLDLLQQKTQSTDGFDSSGSNIYTLSPISFGSSNGLNNILYFNFNASKGLPTFFTRSNGTRIIFDPLLDFNGNNLDNAFGYSTNVLWTSLATTSHVYRYYFGSTTHTIELGLTSYFKEMVIENTTASTSKTTGALRINGGLGVSGNLFASAGTLDSLNVIGSTGSTSKITGAVRITGGLGVGQHIYASRIILPDENTIGNNNTFFSENDYNFATSGPILFTGPAGQNNVLNFNRDASNALPSFGTRSNGTRIILYSSLSGSNLDSAFGVGPGVSWTSVPNTNDRFNFYIGETSYRVSIGANSVATNDFTYKDNVGTMNIKGHLVMDFNGSVTNSILWTINPSGIAKPSFTNRSQGSKLVLTPTISGTLLDYAIGIETQCMWFSVPGVNDVFRYYFGSTTHSIELGNTSYFKSLVAENTDASTNSSNWSFKSNGGIYITKQSIFENRVIIGKNNDTSTGNYRLYVEAAAANTTVGSYGFLTSSGNVGLHSPSSNNNNYAAYFGNRIVVTNEVNVVSDRRVKKNISDIQDMTSIIKNIEPKTYNLLNEQDQDQKHYGFLAQQVQELIPELVSETITGVKIPKLFIELDTDFSFILPQEYLHNDTSDEFTILINDKEEKIKCFMENDKVFICQEHRHLFDTKEFYITQIYLNRGLNINYNGFVPVLLNVVKSLEKRISELENLLNK